MAKVLWEQLFERIEQGMTTVNDADTVRDLYEKSLDLEQELAKFADNDVFNFAFEPDGLQ